jgi:endonuclease/exonuclease/phosphatase family metal-dependent hydrolase
MLLHSFDILPFYAVRVPALRVMSINVRQPDREDGANDWEYRKDLLLETILDCRPDVIGAQELFLLQAEFLTGGAPQYAWFGTGRFGDCRDKHVGIFYRRDAVQPLDRGDFWLSEKPELPGSSSWEIIRPRQVTWGLFETAWSTRFHMFNTHFPYRKVEQKARWKTAELILARIGALDPALPVILTADFNSPARGEIHELLTGCLWDAWLEAPRRNGPEGTLNGFGKLSVDRRIDWILFRTPWKVREVETVAWNRDGVYPSDHYPVVAEFEM